MPTLLLIGAPSFYRGKRLQNQTRIIPKSRSGYTLMGDQDHEPSHAIYYLKSAIEARTNINVKCIDLNIEFYRAFQSGVHFDQYSFLTREIADINPIGVGLSAMRPNYTEALAICRWLKDHAPGIKVFLGGPCTAEKNLPASEAFDFIIRRIDEQQVCSDIIREFSACDFGFPEKAYGSFPNYTDLSGFSDIIPRYFHTVGCGAGCAFCFPAAIREFKVATSPGLDLADRILDALTLISPKFWLLGDLTFYLQSSSGRDLLSRLRDLNRVPWWCQTQARYINEKACKRLAEAGCKQVAFAVEDFSTVDPAIRSKNSGRDTTVEALEMLASYGIKRQLYWCFGLPDDTESSSARRVRDIERLVTQKLVDSTHLSYLMPYPGTPYGDHPSKFGIVIERSFEDHYSEVVDDFYDPLPLHSVRHLSGQQIKLYFDAARQILANPLSSESGVTPCSMS